MDFSVFTTSPHKLTFRHSTKFKKNIFREKDRSVLTNTIITNRFITFFTRKRHVPDRHMIVQYDPHRQSDQLLKYIDYHWINQMRYFSKAVKSFSMTTGIVRM